MKTTVPGMKKYYVVFGLLMVLAVGALVYTASKAGDAKQDRKTTEAFQKAGFKIDSYVISKGQVPASLSTAGVKDAPSTITYSRLDSARYKICVTYKSSGGGFDAGWLVLFGALFPNGGFTSQNQSQDPSPYLDTYTVVFSHKKGQNCQTVKPSYLGGANAYFPTTAGNGSSSQSATSGCGAFKYTGFAVTANVTIDKVDTASKTISLNPGQQYLTDSNYATLNQTLSSIKYDTNTVFCDLNNYTQELSPSGLKAGDNVNIYLKNSVSDTTASQIQLIGGVTSPTNTN